MDVKITESEQSVPARGIAPVAIRQRRALARLGLGTGPAYVAPTLLALRSVVVAGDGAVTVAA